jgi:hypothetical protein
MSKRQPAYINNTVKTAKRKVLSPAESHMKKMLGEIPLMRITPNQSTPKKQVLKKLNAIVETGLITRKQIAVQNGLRYAEIIHYTFHTLISILIVYFLSVDLRFLVN